MTTKETIELFNAVVTDKKLTKPNLDYAKNGFVLDFVPTKEQLDALKSMFAPLNFITLFTPEERNNSSLDQLLSKQILHYIEIYGLNSPGIFNLEFSSGEIASLTYVKGISREELSDSVLKLMSSNAPIKDVSSLKNIIEHFDISFDVNDIKNNELRVSLFDMDKHLFTNGDDAVRWMCYISTENSMLIKSSSVVNAVKEKFSKFKNGKRNFFINHTTVLSNVFNRHKRIILAAKNNKNNSEINIISRLSKNLHIPIKESINKTFINKALNDKVDMKVLDSISIRDKFKFLNLLEYKKKKSDVDVFVIRNGKMHVSHDRKVYNKKKIKSVISEVLKSIKKDLTHLSKSKILIDKNVDYGLPISRKQTMGRLPYGTAISCDGDTLSSGMYWENSWGACDLDLSTINLGGHRVGWGSTSGYTDQSVIYSGDLVNAPNGAMEFMTSNKSYDVPYGLFVNVFSGASVCEMEIVVGGKSDNKKWIDEPIIREKITLNNRGTLLGLVRKGKFIVYSGGISNNRVSGTDKESAIINKATSKMWTIKKLFDNLDIEYDTVRSESVYDHDLQYDQFSYDQLESLFNLK